MEPATPPSNESAPSRDLVFAYELVGAHVGFLSASRGETAEIRDAVACLMASKELAQIGRSALRCLLKAAGLPATAAGDASSLCPVAQEHRGALMAWVREQKQEQRRSARLVALEAALGPQVVAEDRLCQQFVKTGTELSLYNYTTAQQVVQTVLTTQFVEAALPGRVDLERDLEANSLKHRLRDEWEEELECEWDEELWEQGPYYPTHEDIDKHEVARNPDFLEAALVTWRRKFASAEAAAAAAPEVPEHLRARLLEMQRVEDLPEVRAWWCS